ncbi:hypothetical protein AN189_07510 [Loktanella sp. 3ANDIMAR09]|uniref:hypothetical protein n=1 Tax=Loktanella sp. 3ANDIMAR09 TaxID=1225657 RepID=UPI0006F27594|nr:hypothetical protein [Loktanella sp. 3ANDIMAR09]KQI68732.1 hypothetical protein AN189_07510 [Loktanella sp. 3ANDIMAR09]
MRFILAILLLLPAGLRAESLCGVTDNAALLDRLAGDWRGDTYLSGVNAVIDQTEIQPRAEAERVTIGTDGILSVEAIAAAMGGEGLPMVLSPTPVYNVDQVDDLLETTQAEALADVLSDTPCGPEKLPQFVATFGFDQADTDGVRFDGQVVLIPYFDDRILRLDQFDVNTGEMVLFVTVASVLTRE